MTPWNIRGLPRLLLTLLIIPTIVFFLAHNALAEANALIYFRTAHFTFVYHPQEQQSLESLFQEAEELLDKIRGHLPPSLPARVIEVRIASSPDEFIQLQPSPRVPSWALAIAYPQQGTIIMKAPRLVAQGHSHLLPTFRHEVTHVLLHDAFGGRPVPSWLQEGMAQLMEEEWNMSRIAVMAQAVLADQVIPLWDLAGSFPSDLREAEIAYAESYYFLSFLLNRFGRQALQKFILEISHGIDIDVALSRATGLRLREIIDLWEGYLRLRFNWIPVITGGGALWFVASSFLVLGYIIKRRRSRRILEQWEQEEALFGTLGVSEKPSQDKKKGPNFS